MPGQRLLTRGRLLGLFGFLGLLSLAGAGTSAIRPAPPEPGAPLRFPPSGLLEIAAGASVRHYRIAARFNVPIAVAARLTARGQYPELTLHDAQHGNLAVLTTTVSVRRHRNLERAGRIDRRGCGVPKYPAEARFRIEGSCRFVAGGNELVRRVVVARDGDLLHYFAITHRPAAQSEVERLLAGLRFVRPYSPTRSQPGDLRRTP